MVRWVQVLTSKGYDWDYCTITDHIGEMTGTLCTSTDLQGRLTWTLCT